MPVKLNNTNYHPIRMYPLRGQTQPYNQGWSGNIQATLMTQTNNINAGTGYLTYSPMTPPAMMFQYEPDPIESTGIPSVNNVRSGTTYGILMELLGNMTEPITSNVKSGMKYGAMGTEFTGTMASGGLATGAVLIDSLTGKEYIYIKNPLIVGVG
jgi:hypothetical protein